jgi:hypothetical protein
VAFCRIVRPLDSHYLSPINMSVTPQQTPELPFTFGDGFLEDHAGHIITDPRIALIELIANAYDAGATKVEIQWPDSVGQVVTIRDNGSGMTRPEFEHRWKTLCYKRPQEQGAFADNPNKISGKPRPAFGKSGKGRHAAFCFANTYFVTTWKDSSLIEVRVEKETHGEAPFRCHIEREEHKAGHGTELRAELAKGLLAEAEVKELIGAKFAVDPLFSILVNGDSVHLMNLRNLVTSPILVPAVGEIMIHQIDSDVQDRTVQLRGITWWVNRRTVGNPSWEGLDGEGAYLDGRTSLAKRFSFVVEADALKDDVKADWSAFNAGLRFNNVRDAVHSHVVRCLNDIQASTKKERKRAALAQTRGILKELSHISRNSVARFVEQVQEKCPTLSERDLFRTAEVFSKMEQARSGYDLLRQLYECSPEDVDKWNALMQKWTAGSAEIVLNELELRLGLIKKLQDLVESPKADELHDLQPLFERGLWMFGVEYETVDFRSNRGLSTIVRDFLGGTNEQLPNRRPDFIALPERSIGIYGAPAYEDGGEISGLRKVMIVELKKGGFKITQKEVDQARDYAKELRKAADVSPNTEIIGYVLGASADLGLEQLTMGTSTTIRPMVYRTLLDRAHSRTFFLQQRIEALGHEHHVDEEIESVMSQPEQAELAVAVL